MPFDVNSFDIAVIPFPADEGAGLTAPLAEAFRVLRDGGRVSIITRTGTRRSVVSDHRGDPAGWIPRRAPARRTRQARVLRRREEVASYAAQP